MLSKKLDAINRDVEMAYQVLHCGATSVGLSEKYGIDRRSVDLRINHMRYWMRVLASAEQMRRAKQAEMDHEMVLVDK